MFQDPTRTIGDTLRNNGYPEPVKIEALRGDASARRYFCLSLPDEPLSENIPQKLIAMVLPSGSDELFDLIAKTQAFFKRLGCLVPEIYTRDKKNGIFIMENLGTTDMESVLLNGTRSTHEALYKKAIDILLKIQSADCDKEKNPGFTPFTLAFDEEKLMWEMNFFIEHYIEGYRKKQVPEKDRHEFNERLKDLCIEIANAPRVLTHRDFHCRNLMIKDAMLRTIDFQDARMGPRQYDLASLLRDSYFVIDSHLRNLLIDYFLTELDKQNHFETDREEFLRVFELVAFQRNLKALGTFGYMLAKAGKEHFLSALAPTVTYIKEAPDDIRLIYALKSLLVPLL